MKRCVSNLRRLFIYLLSSTLMESGIWRVYRNSGYNPKRQLKCRFKRPHISTVEQRKSLCEKCSLVTGGPHKKSNQVILGSTLTLGFHSLILFKLRNNYSITSLYKAPLKIGCWLECWPTERMVLWMRKPCDIKTNDFLNPGLLTYTHSDKNASLAFLPLSPPPTNARERPTGHRSVKQIFILFRFVCSNPRS